MAEVAEDVAVRIDPPTFRAFLRLKSWAPQSPDARAPIVLDDRELPAQIGATAGEDPRVLCVRPGEWLLIRSGSGGDLYERLAPQAHRQGLSLVDMSDGYGTFAVRGHKARDLLSKGCGLDLHPRSFPVGLCARTRFAQIPVILECVAKQNAFELTAARSYLLYLQSWSEDAALEFNATT